ncbi:hypothetical protein HYQ46_005995 [Verticillium longisporum]|nr:hypothetical protein HYQ46_005995 [Verticillium longisporum]
MQLLPDQGRLGYLRTSKELNQENCCEGSIPPTASRWPLRFNQTQTPLNPNQLIPTHLAATPFQARNRKIN